MNIKTQLTQLRTQHNNMSQAELAEQTGISPQQLNDLENGHAAGIEFETLAKLCVFFHCTPNDLLKIEELDETSSPTEEELKKADEIIQQAFAKADALPPRSPDEIWNSFEEAVNQISEEFTHYSLPVEIEERTQKTSG